MSWGTMSWGTNDSGGSGSSSSGSSSSSSGSGSGSSNPGLRSSSGQLLHQPLVFDSQNPNSTCIVFRLPSQLSGQLGIAHGLFPQFLDHSH